MEDNEYYVFHTCPVCNEVYMDEDGMFAQAVLDGTITQICKECINKRMTKQRSGFNSVKTRLLEEE